MSVAVGGGVVVRDDDGPVPLGCLGRRETAGEPLFGPTRHVLDAVVHGSGAAVAAELGVAR